MAAPTQDRYHALDALRGFAMFLGVLLHAALPYTSHPVPFWPVQDSHRFDLFDLLLVAIHDFRMQLFFLLAGLFGCLLYTRYGAIGTVRHRLKRVALPLILAFLTIQPALQVVSVYAASAQYRADPENPTLPKQYGDMLSYGDGPWDAVVHHFVSGNFRRFSIPAHLWFLWYLLICFAIMLPLASLADRLRYRSLGRAWDRCFHWLFQSRFRWFVLAAITWPLLVPMDAPIGPDTPLSWVPPVHLVAYYLLFFLVGWTLYRHRVLLGRFGSDWGLSLAIANLLVFPIALAFLYCATSPGEVGIEHGEPFGFLAMAALALFTWMTIGGLIGLFQRVLSMESRRIRWLADSSYWCYLASLPLVVLFQYSVADWNVPAIVKFAVVSFVTTALLLLTYRYLVRYTWIGRLLNGPRGMPEKAEVEAKAEVLASAGR